MHVAISVLPSQKEHAYRLLERIADLGGVSQFPALIVTGGEIDLAPLHKLASSAFQNVSVLPIDIPSGHPIPANVLFARTAQHMGNVVGDAYLYLEPDSWPTSTNWLKDLVSVYREHGYRFMGKLAMLPDGSGEHYMLPTGIYPKDFAAKSDLIRQLPTTKSAAEFLQGEIVYRGKAHDSGLFALYGDEDRNASLVLMWEPLRTAVVESEAEYDAGESLDQFAPSKGRSIITREYQYDLAKGTSSSRVPSAEESGPDELPEPTTVVGAYQAEMAKSFPDGEPALGYVPSLVNPRAVDLPSGTVPQGKVSSETVAPDASWPHNPKAFDPNVEVPTPAASIGIPAAMQDPGTLDTYPQPGATVPIVETIEPEAFANEADRNVAIKKDQAAGLGWKSLLSKYHMSPVAMKTVLNSL